MDATRLLLSHGADCNFKNGVSRDPSTLAVHFPHIRDLIRRTKLKREGRHQRRTSTAIPLEFDMFLISLDQLQNLYSKERGKAGVLASHQKLKEMGELIRWEDLPAEVRALFLPFSRFKTQTNIHTHTQAHIIFISHEWSSWNHPDPHGTKIQTLLSAFRGLQNGEIPRVEMSALNAMLGLAKNYVTKASAWKEMLDTSYICMSLSLSLSFFHPFQTQPDLNHIILLYPYIGFDWISFPQPSACLTQKERDDTRVILKRAVKSIPAYIERCDWVTIVCPGSLHVDRRDEDGMPFSLSL